MHFDRLFTRKTIANASSEQGTKWIDIIEYSIYFDAWLNKKSMNYIDTVVKPILQDRSLGLSKL
jgi:hypothetical protein